MQNEIYFVDRWVMQMCLICIPHRNLNRITTAAAKKKLRAFVCFLKIYYIYLVKFVKQTCLTNAAGGCKFDMADVKSYCCSILKRIISTRWTGSRWNRKLFMYDRCFMSSINVWLPTFGTRLKNKMSITALLVLFNSAALGITSGIRVVDRCCAKRSK